MIEESGSGLLNIISVDFSLIDRGGGRVEVAKVDLESRGSDRMNKAQVGLLLRLTIFCLYLIDDQFALVLTNIFGETRCRHAPEEIFGDDLVKYTHVSQFNINWRLMFIKMRVFESVCL